MTAILIPNLVAFVLLLIGFGAASMARQRDRHMGAAIGLLAVPRLVRPSGSGDDDTLKQVIRLKAEHADVWRIFSMFFYAAGGLVIGRFL
ncbi:MAG: hypothetical protein ACK4M2_01540 [Brevundimonas sp.]